MPTVDLGPCECCGGGGCFQCSGDPNKDVAIQITVTQWLMAFPGSYLPRFNPGTCSPTVLAALIQDTGTASFSGIQQSNTGLGVTANWNAAQASARLVCGGRYLFWAEARLTFNVDYSCLGTYTTYRGSSGGEINTPYALVCTLNGYKGYATYEDFAEAACDFFDGGILEFSSQGYNATYGNFTGFWRGSDGIEEQHTVMYSTSANGNISLNPLP